jgi:light-regulated signal transduction histidine kinase (bacteriophytochrome)
VNTTSASSDSFTAVDRAEQLVQAQRELTSLNYAISHDLRAPVRAIAGFGQALKEHTVTTLDATAQHYLSRIEESTQRLSAMIDGLLALSRISQADLQVVAVDVGSLCETVNRDLTQQFPQHHPQVNIDTSAQALCDPHLLRIALRALLHNAWKFTQDRTDAKISVNATTQANIVRLCVRDNGLGFDARYAERLFVPFQHLQTRSAYHGLGIGLASVQRIVNRHGGTVWADATSPGAAFFLTLRCT